MRRMTATGFLSLPADYRLGTPDEYPRALTLNPRTGGTELWPVEIVCEEWHRLYVEVDSRDGSVWEIQRLDGGGEYRILRNLAEVSARHWHWDSIRSAFCNAAWRMCPDVDEPRVVENALSFVVHHGRNSCEVGKAVVKTDREALSYAAIVFDMKRKGRADDEFRQRLRLRTIGENGG
jgi:Uri superfamily endonuclease